MECNLVDAKDQMAKLHYKPVVAKDRDVVDTKHNAVSKLMWPTTKTLTCVYIVVLIYMFLEDL